MKKLLKRWVPLFMALALVVGAVNNNYLTVRATESGAQIGGGTTEADEDDVVLLNSEDEAGADVSGNDADVLENDADVSGNDAGSSLLVSMSQVMLMALSAADVPAVQAEGTYTITIYPVGSQIANNYPDSGGATADARYKIVYSTTYGYSGATITFDKAIDLSQCTKITYNVSEIQGTTNFCLLDESGNQSVYTDVSSTGSYNNTWFTKSGTMAGLKLYSATNSGGMASDGDYVIFESVVFTMTGTGENEVYGIDPSSVHTKTVSPSDFEVKTSWNAVSSAEVENGKMKVLYDPNVAYSQAWLDFSAVDLTNCLYVTFNIAELQGGTNVYLYSSDNLTSDPLFSEWGVSDAQAVVWEVPESAKSSSAARVSLQTSDMAGGGKSNSGDYVVLESVIFTMVGGSSSDTPTGNITPAAKGAEDYSWMSGDMTISYDTTDTSKRVQDTTNKRWTLVFPDATDYPETRFELPTRIETSQCNSVTFAVSAQGAPLAFKLYDGDKEIKAYYGKSGSQTYKFDNEWTGTITHVAVMRNKGDKTGSDVSCTFDGVMFDMQAPEEKTYEVTYGASDLTLAEVSGEGATSELKEDRHCITFPALNNGARYTIPETIALANCKSITIKVGSQTGPVNFYTCMDGTELQPFYYNTGKDSYTIVPSKGNMMNSLKVLCGGEEYTPGSYIEIISVTFLMKGVRLENPVVKGNATICSAGCFDFDNAEKEAGVTTTAQMTADGQRVEAEVITFEQAGLDLTIEIPATVDVNYLKSITLDFTTKQYISGQARGLLGGRFATAATGVLRVAAASGSSGVTVSLLNRDKNVIADADSSNIVTLSKYFTGAKYIRFTSTGPTEMRLSGITFNVEPPIVLNGNFEDDDVSMWTGGWSSIEAVSGDSAIVGGVSTYGKITDRTSPYQGFIQDVTARVTNGKIYKFSFWAKLSDTYKDADASLREVTFSPYYKDENGNDQYGLVPGGNYKQSLTAGEWTYFEGTVTIPANSTGFVIRIVEQGTNYGQGDCLKGEYYVTGVKMWETDREDPGAGNGGGGGGGGGSYGGSNNRVPTKESKYEITYEVEDLEVSWASASTKTVATGTQVNFSNNYDEARFKLPRPLDMSLCAFLQVKTSGQNVPIAIKLYKNGSQVQVDYYNQIGDTYMFIPTFEGNIDAVGIMSLATPNPAGATVTVDSFTFGFTQELPPYVAPSGIVWNGDFADEDLSDWYAAYWDNVTITREIAKTPIYDDVRTYATYSRRTSPYQCFAQDITDRVEQGETYTFSFWAKLSDDYKDAPPEQRVVQFSPYTEDKNGVADYNPRLEGTYSQVLEPGVWTYFEGTYKVTNENPIGRVVIRILEQGTNYGQGDCVKGSYSITGVKMDVYIPEPPSIDEDVPNLRDETAEDFGSDFLMGTAMDIGEVDDIGIEMLIKKHFNAVTIGNELKPDALFGYSNSAHTELKTITFNGQSLEVPTLNYTRAEEVLNKILEWNEAQPDKPIKVRGHVLVWHAQTPEWFFREGYTVKQNADGTENYVTPEVMNLRLEWYIKTVLEHFTGEDSPYKDLFYGWDVVNEAVADSGIYRSDKVNSKEQPGDDTHGTNSSWWAVYHSNEFIVNAFKYANKYAPADLELYYNDYNDSEPNKVKGISLLLTDVLAEEGTRIDAMGMQCHYTLGYPTLQNMEKAIRTYAEIVGTVQLTEFDLKAAGNIESESGLEKEYKDQAVRYHEIYELLKKLDAEDGIEIGGFTVWGTIDSHSWLQSSSSVGGGADGTMSQCPLLFDSNYKVKPAYWALVDYSKVDPEWKEAEAEKLPGETEPAQESEQPEEPSSEEELKAASVAAASPKKSSPIPIVIAVCVAVAAVGGGSAYVFLRKKKEGGGTARKK